MWIGQLGCEAFNWILKKAIKQERPTSTLFPVPYTALIDLPSPALHGVGGGYGFPSSHAQFMGFFASFMLLHLYFRHRFVSCGIPLLDFIWSAFVRLAVVALALIVCYSR